VENYAAIGLFAGDFLDGFHRHDVSMPASLM